MASLLTQDLASESEDDDFNPAPAEESDNSQSSTTRRVNGTVRDNLGEKGGDQGKRGASINGEGEDGEEEESGDEEDDEEEVNSVSHDSSKKIPIADLLLESATQASKERSKKPIPGCRSRGGR